MLVWDGTEVSTPSLDDVPSARRVILRMAATALVVLVLVALGGVVAASRLAERDAIHSGADIVGLLADAVVQPHVTDAVVADLSAARHTVGAAFGAPPQVLLIAPASLPELGALTGTASGASGFDSLTEQVMTSPMRP